MCVATVVSPIEHGAVPRAYSTYTYHRDRSISRSLFQAHLELGGFGAGTNFGIFYVHIRLTRMGHKINCWLFIIQILYIRINICALACAL